MALFRQNLNSGMNFLRRHFSSDDLYQDRDDASADSTAANDHSSHRMNLPGRKPSMPSGSSFPTLSSVQDMTRGILSQAAAAASSVTDAVSSVTSGSAPAAAAGATSASLPPRRVVDTKDHCKILLVIDDTHSDWAKYFRGRKICGDWDLKVYQADFASIHVTASSHAGAVVDILLHRHGNNTIQSFQPDLVLVRQHARDASDNWKHVVLALHYGGVPSINSLHSIYNFLDKPWVFSHLLRIQRRLGSQQFPLIDQSFYPNYRQMISNLWVVMPKFPLIVKIGHAYAGIGKVKVDEHYSYQDVASVMAITDCYSTAEPHVDAVCDVYVQKIGPHYRAYVRKAMSGNWKANVGAATLEQIPLTDRYKLWADECSQLFGGLDILAVKALRARDGREYIIEVDGSSMSLLGNNHDDDMRHIAELTISRLQALVYSRPAAAAAALPPAPPSVSQQQSNMGSATVVNGPISINSQPQPAQQQTVTSSLMSSSMTTNYPASAGSRQLPQTPAPVTRQQQQQQPARPPVPPPRPPPQHQMSLPPYSTDRATMSSSSSYSPTAAPAGSRAGPGTATERPASRSTVSRGP